MALTDGLIAYWKLDESSGNATDSVGSNTLTNTNITYSAGKINNGSAFNGSSSYFTPTSASSLNDLSISFWIKPTSSNNEVLFFLANNPYYYNVFEIDYKDGRIESSTYHISSGSGVITDNIVLSKNVFSLVTITRTGTAVKIYVNGVHVASSGSVQNISVWGNAGNSRVGCHYNSTSFFNGMLDEIGIWNRVLGDAEIAQLDNGGAGLSYPFIQGVNPGILRRRLL